MSEKLIYVYCVADKEPEIKAAVGGLTDNLHFISHSGIYAVVSMVEEDEFSEENLKKNLADINWIEKKARVHEGVIEGIMKSSVVLPLKFATLFNTEENLKAILEEKSSEFKENLEYLRDKEEWGVKIYCDIDKLKENITRVNGDILKMTKEIDSGSAGKSFFLKKKKEEMLTIAVNKKIQEYGQDSFNRLREQSINAKINKLLPEEVTEKKEKMILNSAFLVEKDKVNAFNSTVDILKKQYKEIGILFDCTGPWPAYNFTVGSGLVSILGTSAICERSKGTVLGTSLAGSDEAILEENKNE